MSFGILQLFYVEFGSPHKIPKPLKKAEKHQSKRCDYNNKDEVISPNILNNYQASQKLRQIIYLTNRLAPSRYYHSRSKWTWEYCKTGASPSDAVLRSGKSFIHLQEIQSAYLCPIDKVVLQPKIIIEAINKTIAHQKITLKTRTENENINENRDLCWVI